MDELLKQSSARGCVFLLNDRYDHGFAARGFDLLERGLAEAVRVDGELLGELTVAEDLDLNAAALDETSLAQCDFVDLGARGELL